ncbi:hypothetical protein BKA61DRAFT_580638 [Leptodontidium sp. MPI-SDFR-AT-0119]|nr:hypothetical protein BKA61DRAFT_580638 [Leptodontidium sp. MPI-SDFR-AT-0119]
MASQLRAKGDQQQARLLHSKVQLYKAHRCKTLTVTAVSTAHGPFVIGDLAAVLDANLASRLNEIIHRMSECADRRDFNNRKTLRRRASPRYGAAICAVKGVTAIVQLRGALGNLLLLNPGQLRFRFIASASDVARVARVAVGFVQTYAPMLELPDDMAVQLGNFPFALAVDTLINNLPLREENRIEATLLTTETVASSTMVSTTSTTSTSSGCPDPTSSPIITRQNCLRSLEEIQNVNQVCLDIRRPNRPQQPILWPNAMSKTAVEFLARFFGGTTNNIYNNFCGKWVPETELKLTVDAIGSSRAPVRKLILRPRVPSQDLSNYMYYNIDLGFTPFVGGEKCVHESMQAFGQITSGCSNIGCGEEIYPSNPLAFKDAGPTYYQELLIDNYKKCRNRRVRGNIQAECLVYNFKASTIRYLLGAREQTIPHLFD